MERGMVKYTQAQNSYLLQFYPDKIDVVTIKPLAIARGYSDIKTKSYLHKNHYCYYMITNHKDFSQFVVLPAVFTNGEVRFTIYTPTDLLLLDNTPLASIYPIASAYEKIQHLRMDKDVESCI
jgi:spore coat polysaccharide biosynthesis protein SpsF (cytidylyltransferase family)